MKKFYYSKEASQDESLIDLPLEHHKTMDINSEQERSMSARAASVSSLNLLSEAPTIPRVQTRDITRSKSDILTKTQSNAQKLVTESELSTSWLYKNMQASINARFKSPRKSPSIHKTRDLEQSMLQDSELKTIPTKSKAAKTSSCICHFATMTAISLCAVGFLACIAAVIYMEVFADRNITSLHTTEAEVDLSDVVMDTREAYNLTTHIIEGEERILSEARTHRFDGDEEILNDILKTSSTNDLHNSSNKTDDNHDKFSDSVTDSGMIETSELKHYIGDANTKIKFKDDSTIIYEIKSEVSTEDEVGPNLIPEFKGRSFGTDSDEADVDDSETDPGKSTENVPKEIVKQELLPNVESQNTTVNDSVDLKNTEGTEWESHDFMVNENRLKNDSEEIASKDELKLKAMSENVKLDNPEENKSTEKIFLDITTIPSEKFNSPEIIHSEDFELQKGSNPDTSDLSHSNDKIKLPNKLENYSNIRQNSEDSDAISTNLFDSPPIQVEDTPSIFKENDQTVENEYDVNTMLVTVDDIEVSTDSFISKRNGDVNTMLVTVDDTEASTDSFMSKRNGDVNFFQVSSAIPSMEPVKQISGNSFISPKKQPVDIKVSLAEAMKHLQNIDVNNKILTSRTKAKPKVKNIQKPTRKTVSNKDEERRRYLQQMRLMLFKQMQ